MFADFGGERKHVLQRCSVLERPPAGALDHRAIGKRIAERNAKFNHARTRVNGRQNDLARGCETGVATGYVGDERWLIFKVKGHEGIVDCRSQIAEVGSRPGGDAGGFPFLPIFSNL